MTRLPTVDSGTRQLAFHIVMSKLRERQSALKVTCQGKKNQLNSFYNRPCVKKKKDCLCGEVGKYLKGMFGKTNKLSFVYVPSFASQLVTVTDTYINEFIPFVTNLDDGPILELWDRQSTPFLSSLPGRRRSRVIATEKSSLWVKEK